MNSRTSFPPSKSIIVVSLLAAGLGLWLLQQRALGRARESLAQATEAQVRATRRRHAAEAAVETARRDATAERAARDRLRAALAATEQELVRGDPESRWANPPIDREEWDPESPYVWLRKELLAELHLPAFGDQGELRPETASVLAVPQETQRTLNARLDGILREYRALETAQAERVEENLPGITADGPRVTFRVQPPGDEGTRFKQQFEATVREELGRQRADLLLQTAEGWLDTQFSGFGTEPKTISLVRHPDGTFNISIQSGHGWFSTGGFTRLEDYVPPHLVPLFATELDRQ